MTAYQKLVEIIQKTSEEGVSLGDAEGYAGKALFVMNDLSEQLTLADKDRRMRKRGVKGIRSAMRIEEIGKHDKKPTEGALEDAVNLNKIVQGEEEAFDNSEVHKEELERQYSIAKETHLYFRGISRGGTFG